MKLSLSYHLILLTAIGLSTSLIQAHDGFGAGFGAGVATGAATGAAVGVASRRRYYDSVERQDARAMRDERHARRRGYYQERRPRSDYWREGRDLPEESIRNDRYQETEGITEPVRNSRRRY